MSISEHAGSSGNTFYVSVYHPSYAFCDTPFMTYINCYCFSTEVPSCGSHYNAGYALPCRNIGCNDVNGVNNMKLSVAFRS